MQFELSSPMKKLNFQFDDNRDGNSIKFARENRYNMINIKQTIQIILNFQTFPSITIAKSLNKKKKTFTIFYLDYNFSFEERSSFFSFSFGTANNTQRNYILKVLFPFPFIHSSS